MSILELARIVTAPDSLEQLHKVTQLHAIEREMMLGRLKRNAFVRLAELTEEVPAASADEVRASEVMRKACVDLLRYGTPGSTPAPGNARTRTPSPLSVTDTLSPASEAEILEALERWGQEEEEHHRHHDFVQDGGQAPTTQITDSPACPPGRGRITQMGSGKSKCKSGDGNEHKYEPRASGEPQGPPRRTSRPAKYPTPELAPPLELAPPPITTSNVIPSQSRYHAQFPETLSPREGRSPSKFKSPPELIPPLDKRLHSTIQPPQVSSPFNGPGARASGSLGDCPGKMPEPPPDADRRKFHDDGHPP